jgi:hypothetical protein
MLLKDLISARSQTLFSTRISTFANQLSLSRTQTVLRYQPLRSVRTAHVVSGIDIHRILGAFNANCSHYSATSKWRLGNIHISQGFYSNRTSRSNFPPFSWRGVQRTESFTARSPEREILLPDLHSLSARSRVGSTGHSLHCFRNVRTFLYIYIYFFLDFM